MFEDPLFRFAIISDTHIRPKGESSSPWRTNLLTNDRARWVTQTINRFAPDFIIHLGDIVHPVPHLTTYGPASKMAKHILENIKAPVYYVPGNHDIGDKDNPTVPSYIINNSYIRNFRKYYGPTYQSFDHKDIHFILINSPVLNSDLLEEKEQKKWLENDLYENIGRRTIILSHYPPYLYQPSESNNYDNIDLPIRNWLLELLRSYKVEMFFAGHVHQFGYKRYHGTHIYNLLSTCFVRQDFSEMFRVGPADEFGRNDKPKLGYCVVDVFSNTHKVSVHRSYGETLGEDDKRTRSKWLDPPKSSTSLISPIGVHLRHPLTETIELPYMGPIDEFVRKRMRNDYPVLALWETGIKYLRLPLEDIKDKETRKRLSNLHELGHRFSFFTINIPDHNFLDENKNIIDFLEVIIPWEKARAKLPEASKLREYTDLPIYVANIESSIHRERKGPKFSHYMCHGFHVSDTEQLESILSKKGLIDGFVFQVDQNDKPLECIKKVSEYSECKGIKAVVNVRLSSEDPAEYFGDEDNVARRIVEAVVATYAYPDIRVFLDTFVDHDRGYFPRIGIYDRRINPRKSAHIVKNLNTAIQLYGRDVSVDKVKSGVILFNSGNISFKLCTKSSSKSELDSTLVDLVTGEVNPDIIGDWILEINQSYL